MALLEIILMMSVIMWYIIDRLKPLWADLKGSAYITTAVAAVLASVLCIGYNLDIICAFGIVPEPGVIGIALTILLLMGGSSAVAELVERLKGVNK